MNLKQNLKRILLDLDMTAAQLSRKAGAPKTTLAEWLSGSNPRDLSKVKQVADFLGLTVDSLCFGDGGVTEQPFEKHLDEIQAGVYEVILRKVTKKI